MSSDQRTLPAMAILLGELLTNTKGGKSLPLRREGSSEPVVWQSAEVQKILWQPSAYNDADAKRVPICLEPVRPSFTLHQSSEDLAVATVSSRGHVPRHSVDALALGRRVP